MLHEYTTCGATNADEQTTAETGLMPARAKRTPQRRRPQLVSRIPSFLRFREVQACCVSRLRDPRLRVPCLWARSLVVPTVPVAISHEAAGTVSKRSRLPVKQPCRDAWRRRAARVDGPWEAAAAARHRRERVTLILQHVAVQVWQRLHVDRRLLAQHNLLHLFVVVRA